MAIGYDYKDRNAEAGSHESEWRDDDANLVKDAVEELQGIVTGSATIVSSKSDFPAPISGVITLVAGVTYRIAGAISIGTDRIVTNGANLVGLSLFTDSITYTGTSTMLTITSVNFDCRNLTLNATNGTLVSATGGATHRVLFNSVLSSSSTFGTINSIGVFEYAQGNIAVTTNGMLFAGTPTALILTATGFNGLLTTGTYVDFGTAVFAVGGDAVTVRANPPSGVTFMSGLAAGANFGVGFRMSGGFFGATGTGIVLAGIDVNDVNVTFTGNIGLQDSDHRAMVYVAQGDEAETAITGGDGDLGNPTPVLGTFTEVISQRWTTSSEGILTYHNGATTEVYRFTATLTIEPAAGTNNVYHFYIAKNGVVEVHTAAHIQVDTNDPEQITIQGDISATDGDQFQIYAEDQTGTQAFTAQNVNFGVDN